MLNFTYKKFFVYLSILVLLPMLYFGAKIGIRTFRKANQKLNFLIDLQMKMNRNIDNIVLFENYNYFVQQKNILSAPISRVDFISKIEKIHGDYLEIGPYFNPILKGDNVFYFDIFNKDGLLKKAIEGKISEDALANIPEIDFIDSNGDMSAINKNFSMIFSSHNIEHQVNLIKHLQQVEKLLIDGGKFFLIVPDKRYCFDHFINLTPISEVLANYYEQPKRHSLQAILAMKCETTHNDPVMHWNESGKKKSYGPNFFSNSKCFEEAVEEFRKSDDYIDSHKWRFTPESFAYMIEFLNQLGLIKFKVQEIFNTMPNTFEFYVILVKS